MNTANVELQLSFLAKELELERNRRRGLQEQVERMEHVLLEVDEDGKREMNKQLELSRARVLNMKPFNPDLNDIRTLNRGFVSI